MCFQIERAVKLSIINYNRWKIPREGSRIFTGCKQEKYLEKFLSIPTERKIYIHKILHLCTFGVKTKKLVSLDDVINVLLINNSLFHYFLCFHSSLVATWTPNPMSLLSKCVWTESVWLPLHGGSLNISGYLERGQVACHLLSALPKPSLGLIWGTVAGAPQADTWSNQLKDWRGVVQGQGQSRPPPSVVPMPHVVFPRMLESADQREGQPGSF